MESADWSCRQRRDCLSADCDDRPQSSAGGLPGVCGIGLAAVGDGSAGSVIAWSKVSANPAGCDRAVPLPVQLHCCDAFHFNPMVGAVVGNSRQPCKTIDPVALLMNSVSRNELADSLSHSDVRQNCSNLRQRGLTRRCIPQYAVGFVTCERPPLNGRSVIMASRLAPLLHHMHCIA